MKNQNTALKASCAALNVLDNIRIVRGVMRNGRFTEQMFDSINGKDCALESLLGRQVVIAATTPEEKTHLRRDILDSLLENEIRLYKDLRKNLMDYFAPIDTGIEAFKSKAEAANTAATEALAKVPSITADAKEAMFYGSFDSPIFAAASVEGACKFIRGVATMLTEVTPVMARVLADAKEATETAPAPATLPTTDTTNGAAQAEPAPTEPEPPMNDPDHTVEIVGNPADEDDPAVTEIAETFEDDTGAEEALKGVVTCSASEPATMFSLGYNTPEIIASAVKDINESSKVFAAAAEGFRQMFPVATCTSEELGYASPKFMRALGAVGDIVIGATKVLGYLTATQDGLVQSIESLAAFKADESNTQVLI